MQRLALAIVALFTLSARGADAPAPSLARPAERLTNEQREDRTEKALQSLRDLVGQTEKLLGQAKDEKDLVKLNCVTEKVGLVRGLLKVSEAAAAELKDAIARKEDDAAEHEYTKVALASRKVASLREDAEQCIGQLAYFNDEKTLVDVDVPAGLPSADPTFVAAPPVVISRPPPASGF